MAKNGTLRTGVYGHRNYHLAIDWSESSQSVSNNSTTLYYKIYADNNGYSNSWIQYYNVVVKIEGTAVFTGNNIRGYKGQTLKTGTITIPHNSDGNKNVLFEASANLEFTNSNLRSLHKNVAMTRIDRGIYDFKLGDGWNKVAGAKKVTFKKYNSNARVELWMRYWDYEANKKSGYYEVVQSNNSIITNHTSNQSFYAKSSFIDSIKRGTKNNWKGWVYISAWVYIGDKHIQTLELEKPDIIVSESKPALNFTAEFVGKNQNLLGSNLKGLRAAHKLKISITANAKDYASIKNYEITFDGKKTITTNNVIELDATTAGSKTVSVKAVDSRYWTTTESKTVTVLEYTPPTVSQRAYRLEGGKENPVGQTGRIEGIVNIYDVKNSSGSSINVPYWRLSLDNVLRNTVSIMYSTSISIEEKRAYTLEYGDKFTTSTIQGVIPIGKAPLVIGEEAIGINTVPPLNQKGLFVNGNVFLNDVRALNPGGWALNFHNKATFSDDIWLKNNSIFWLGGTMGIQLFEEAGWGGGQMMFIGDFEYNPTGYIRRNGFVITKNAQLWQYKNKQWGKRLDN